MKTTVSKTLRLYRDDFVYVFGRKPMRYVICSKFVLRVLGDTPKKIELKLSRKRFAGSSPFRVTFGMEGSVIAINVNGGPDSVRGYHFSYDHLDQMAASILPRKNREYADVTLFGRITKA